MRFLSFLAAEIKIYYFAANENRYRLRRVFVKRMRRNGASGLLRMCIGRAGGDEAEKKINAREGGGDGKVLLRDRKGPEIFLAFDSRIYCRRYDDDVST